MEDKQKDCLTDPDICKGSSSFGSESSTASEDITSTASEDISENSARNLHRKKKQMYRNRETCRSPENLLPPPPPPPPSSSVTCETNSSAEVSSFDETMSSKDSESESDEVSDVKSSSESESDENADTCALKRSKHDSGSSSVISTVQDSSDFTNDIYDIFLFSTSSSEFEGFSSTPKKKAGSAERDHGSDVFVSSVHTSDLSSFEDEISDDDYLCDDDSKGEVQRIRKRLTLKEAEEMLRAKAEKQRSAVKEISPTKIKYDVEKSPSRNFQKTAVLSSEEETSPRAEPRRELRRERKLNPKYASNEYTSIFDSKKTSFITKQLNQSDSTHESNMDSAKSKRETDVSAIKEKPTSRKKSLLVDSDESEVKLAENISESVKDLLQESSISVQNKIPITAAVSSTECANVFEGMVDLYSSDNNRTADDFHHRVTLTIKRTPRKCSQASNDSNSRGVKRKCNSEEKSCVKRTCSPSSMDSYNSECAANENKPFNNEKKDISSIPKSDQKNHKVRSELQESLDTDKLRKNSFRKQKTNNNGDILGKIEHLK